MSDKPSLADLTYYANRSQGGVGAEELSGDRARAALAAAQAYDPGAAWRQVFGGDGQSLGYTLDFDASKMPGLSGQGALGGTSGHGSGADYQMPFSTVQPNMRLSDPNAVTNSPAYGKVTDNRNIQQQDDWITKWGGPALVAAFAFGAPSLASLMSNGALGSGAAAAGAGSAGAQGASAAGSGGSLPSGLGGGAADELANGGQMIAGAPGASQASIGLSNFLAEHGIPTQLGMSEGAVGAAASEPLFGFGGSGSLLQNAGKLVTGLFGSPTGAAGGAGGGGGGGLLGGAGGGGGEDAMSILSRFYGVPQDNVRRLMTKVRNG